LSGGPPRSGRHGPVEGPSGTAPRAERWVGPALLAVVPARIALDLVASVCPPLPQLGTAAIAALLAVAVAARWREALIHPWRAPIAALAVAVAIGALRAPTPYDAARYGLHLALPSLWILALGAWPIVGGAIRAAPLPAPWTAAAALAALASLALLASGQPADHVLHGWPRLHGPYANLHSHAAAMATFAATALPLAARSRSAALLGVAATVCVGATWVRGAWLWVTIAVAVALAVRRRWALLGALAAATAAAALGPLSPRLADLGALLTATPPAGGWGALGSWRVRIWGDVVTGWVSGGPVDVLLGRGLGDHYGLHRHLEPHSDALSIAVQLGLVGLVAWLALHAIVLLALARRARADDRALAALAGLSGALCVALVSNDYAFRPTATLWLMGLAALAAAPGPPPPLAVPAGPAAPRAPSRA
jgi:hypothetical protein